jgi:hypothetical protein
MRKSIPSLLCVIAAVVLSIGRILAEEPKPPVKVEATEIRTYNISELIHEVRNYSALSVPELTPADGANAGGPGAAGGDPAESTPAGQKKVPAPKPNTSVERTKELIKLIEDLVAPETWRDAGGQEGAIHAINDSLVIRQTEANHRAIKEILDNLRHESDVSSMIQVDLHWVRLTPEQLTLLEAPHGTGADPGLPRAVSLESLKEEDSVVCRARTLGFNGPTLTLRSGRVASAVTSATPVVGAGVAMYDFQTERAQSGITLQVTPRRSQDRRTIVVDLQSLVTESAAPPAPIGEIALPPVVKKPADQGVGEATIVAAKISDRPNQHIEQSFRTTVRLAEGMPIIVGGMTLEPGKQGSRQLYLVVSARALETSDKPGK